jgi:hypothetical protein
VTLTSQEYTLRLIVLAMGFVIMMVGAAMAWRTKREFTPLILIAFGALSIVAASSEGS